MRRSSKKPDSRLKPSSLFVQKQRLSFVVLASSCGGGLALVLGMSKILTASLSTCTSSLPMPPIGLGTYLMGREVIRQAIPSALQAGYRRIDCAPVYFNDDVLGDVLAEEFQRGDIARQDLYIVSKLASPFHRKEHVELAVRKTLTDLRLDYLDLYLVHWPIAFRYVEIDPTVRGFQNEDIDDSDGGKNIDPNFSVMETWAGMEDLVDKGLVREIGVSNFPVSLLHELLSQAKIKPKINQVELHPYLHQTKLLQYCEARGIGLQAYSPLGTPGYKGEGEPDLISDSILHRIASSHNWTVPGLCLKWALQRGTTVVAKSSSAIHQKENLGVLDLSGNLTEAEMQEIASLDRGYRFFRPEDWWGELGHVFD